MSAYDAVNAVSSINSADAANVLVRTSPDTNAVTKLYNELVLRGFKTLSLDARETELHNLIIPGFVRMTLHPDLRRADVLILVGLDDSTDDTYRTFEGLIVERRVNEVPVPHLTSVILVTESIDSEPPRLAHLAEHGNIIFTTEI